MVDSGKGQAGPDRPHGGAIPAPRPAAFGAGPGAPGRGAAGFGGAAFGAGRPLPRPARKTRPLVLLILQGAHHLDLYRNILAQCRAVDWVCLIHGIETIPRSRLTACHAAWGTRFVTDRQTAMQHFGDIDAVVTTFAVPHPAHLPYLPLVALAYDLGLPVFELQHGLFQIGISYDRDSAVIGAGAPGANSGLPVRNLVGEQLRWWGPGAIGYPPFTGRGARSADGSEAGGEDGLAPGPAGLRARLGGPVAFLTNFHWDLLGAEDTAAAYDMIVQTILALPEVPFVLAPHPSEPATLPFRRLLERLALRRAGNWRLLPASDTAGRQALLQGCALAIAGASTVLLDLEMGEVPTAVFGLDCLDTLYDLFASCIRLRDTAAMVGCVRQTLQEGWLPTLRTGCLQPFDAGRLQDRLVAAMPPAPLPHDRFVPVINRYLQKG